MSKLIDIAIQEFGVKEISGSEHNMTIIQYAHESGFMWVNDDETPWCSIFTNWVAMKARYIRSNKATARSWLGVGTGIVTPTLGDIIVLQRGNSSWQGHVGFFVNYSDEKEVNILSGNQGNEVNISPYSRQDILGFRRLHRIPKLQRLQSIVFNRFKDESYEL